MSSVYRWGTEGESAFNNRTVIGQILNLGPDEGLMTVRLTSGPILKMVIPLLGLSYPLSNRDGSGLLRPGTRASWMRYMPQFGDYVKVSFGLDGRPEAIGPASWGDLPSEAGLPGHLGGYAQLSRARDRGELGEFAALRPGEWDMRSSGGAYIKGSEFGTLTLAGGSVTMLLKREADEIDARAGLLRFRSTGCEMRLGDVKRTSAGGFQEEVVPGSSKELSLTVAEAGAPAPAPPTEYYTFKAGDIRDSGGMLWTSTAGAPLRLQEEVTGYYTRQVDTQGVARTESSGDQNIVSGSQVNVEAPQVRLGSSGASQSFVLGDNMVGELQTFLGTTIATMNVIATAFAAFETVLTLPQPVKDATKLAATASTALGQEALRLSAALPGTLSTKVKGE